MEEDQEMEEEGKIEDGGGSTLSTLRLGKYKHK